MEMWHGGTQGHGQWGWIGDGLRNHRDLLQLQWFYHSSITIPENLSLPELHVMAKSLWLTVPTYSTSQQCLCYGRSSDFNLQAHPDISCFPWITQEITLWLLLQWCQGHVVKTL